MLNCIEAIDGEWFVRERPYSNMVMEFSNCFAMLRSALNFPIFYTFGSRFRRLFKGSIGLKPLLTNVAHSERSQFSQAGLGSKSPSPICSRYDLIVRQIDERTMWTATNLHRSASAESADTYLRTCQNFLLSGTAVPFNRSDPEKLANGRGSMAESAIG